MPNYPLKIIHSLYLVNTFYDLFRHIYISPDSLDSHMKQDCCRSGVARLFLRQAQKVSQKAWWAENDVQVCLDCKMFYLTKTYHLFVSPQAHFYKIISLKLFW